ncbi:MAG: hypothetical protein IMY71_04360 [Bacteroidetes bacterium]|nr:hypothetical protein [Bacteroidota bacterium]
MDEEGGRRKAEGKREEREDERTIGRWKRRGEKEKRIGKGFRLILPIN